MHGERRCLLEFNRDHFVVGTRAVRAFQQHSEIAAPTELFTVAHGCHERSGAQWFLGNVCDRTLIGFAQNRDHLFFGEPD
jgi:hypothetical protein